jgi:hypothetical protein
MTLPDYPTIAITVLSRECVVVPSHALSDYSASLSILVGNIDQVDALPVKQIRGTLGEIT